MNNGILHWDGKMLPDITGNEKVERLPVLVSQKTGVQLLGGPKIPTSSGQNMADAIFTLVNEWNVKDNIVGLCFDITINQFQFESQWKNIDQSQYEPGIRNDFIRNNLQDISKDLIKFCQIELGKEIVRDDYRELLELTLIFLGFDFFKGNVNFRKPGARHHARWMSKALYALKIFMFLKIFKISEQEELLSPTFVCL